LYTLYGESDFFFSFLTHGFAIFLLDFFVGFLAFGWRGVGPVVMGNVLRFSLFTFFALILM
jgi:hypothetical protein